MPYLSPSWYTGKISKNDIILTINLRKNKYQLLMTNPRDALHHVNVLQTKVDAYRDKPATELNWQRLRRSICRNSAILIYPTCIWCFRWGWPRLSFAETFGSRKLYIGYYGLSCGVVCVILRLAVSVEHRLVTDRHLTTAYTALTWRRAVKRSRILRIC